ncbi:MAG: SLC13/DASS family transporter [Verrucomicrobiae bacterium]|nr:SLC13/DASS family transporter [Verrucomicrobiae bacterium]MCP5539403.1 SLC13/DASS family transporter [Akkermansiaceae bacterium]MCP5551079.1 SLC13/DASS family transporter [Akkermansiaceae bacterium]
MDAERIPPPEAAGDTETDGGVTTAQRVGLWLGLALFGAVLLFANLDPDNPLVTRTAAVAVLMAVWWITEAIPLAATSLVPLVAFPALGVLSAKDTASVYVNDTIFLYVGGFLIALAMERWNLHRRVALWIVRAIGGGPDRLVLSFLVASAGLSMWISNTATSIMMLAIGLAIVFQTESIFGRERTARLSTALLLAIAYGASVGGLATPVGTPTNLSLFRILPIVFPDAPDAPIGFAQWMLIGVPVMLVMLAAIWLVLTRVFFRSPAELTLPRESIRGQYRALGKVSFAEAAVLAVFVATALLWVFRQDLTLGNFTLPGWARLVPNSELFQDGTIAVAMALTLFLIPSRAGAKNGTPAGKEAVRILDQHVFARIPWNIVLLFGGGYALAKGFQSSGLSAFFGQKFAALEGAPPLAVVTAVCTLLTFLTELTSNTATAEMALPILAAVANAMKVHPFLLMIPATLAASCAFMMPVATPPNAIVFSSGRLRIIDMVKAGIVINLIGVVVIALLFHLLGGPIFHIDPGNPPDWAKGG